MGYLGNREDREKNFKEDSLIDITKYKGYGIRRITDNKFMGFVTNRGIISIWNEPRKAKLAFAYHTKNTIDERANDYEIVELYESKQKESKNA